MSERQNKYGLLPENETIIKLYIDRTPIAQYFRNNIRSFNNNTAFAAVIANKNTVQQQGHSYIKYTDKYFIQLHQRYLR